VELVGYVVAAAVVAFGLYVVRRLILSWRRTYRTGPDHGAGDPRRAGGDPDGGTPSG
jgi:hypothetical protein